MSRKTFINLPVKDLAKTTEFFSGLGFSFNQQFADENGTCMVISDDTYAMLHLESSFKEFIMADLADTSQGREVIVGVSADSKEQVYELVGKAVAAGAEAVGEPEDQGYMCMGGFRDLDGHQWSFLYMDMSAIPG